MKIFRSDALIRDGDSLLIFYRPETREEEEHTHDFIEIVYIRSAVPSNMSMPRPMLSAGET